MAAVFTIEADSLDAMLRQSIEHLLTYGDSVTSSRGASKEVRGALLRLTEPRFRLSRSVQRGQFIGALAEFAWYVSGSDSIEQMLHYIPRYRDFIGSGSGAYGPRLFGEPAAVRRIVDLLQRKPSTRQAVIQIFDSGDLDRDPRDVPCTCTLQFLQRGGHLELIAHMRSNDVMLGMPFDVFSFTMIQELVARNLGLELGTYTHFVGSLHLYDENSADAKDYLDEGYLAQSAMPYMPKGDPWDDVTQFVAAEAAVRAGQAPGPTAEPYWRDLITALQAHRASRDKDSKEVDRLRRELVDSSYDIYLNELEWRAKIHERAS